MRQSYPCLCAFDECDPVVVKSVAQSTFGLSVVDASVQSRPSVKPCPRVYQAPSTLVVSSPVVSQLLARSPVSSPAVSLCSAVSAVSEVPFCSPAYQAPWSSSAVSVPVASPVPLSSPAYEAPLPSPAVSPLSSSPVYQAPLSSPGVAFPVVSRPAVRPLFVRLVRIAVPVLFCFLPLFSPVCLVGTA